MSIPYLGEIFSFSCAIFWAAAIIFFRKSGEFTSPFSLNFFKNVLALILFLLTSLFFHKTLLVKVPFQEYILLIISGIIGIAIADTLFFRCLNLLGAGLTALINCLYTPIMISLSVIFLKEKLSIIQILGALLIISAILVASLQLTHNSFPRKKIFLGIMLGFISVLSMAVSIIMIKPLLNRSSILWVTEIRLIAGTIIMGIIVAFHPNKKEILHPFRFSKNLKFQLPGVILGAYLAMIIWIAGMKYTYVSIATAISQTSVIFVLIFAAIFLKERFTLRRFIGMVMAFSGVLMVTVG